MADTAMQHYVGTKIVRMQPMNRQQYNDFREWPLPLDEDGNDDGYLVEYLDGGKPNTPHFAGYVSWSPKEQAEKAYLPLGNLSGLEDWQQELVAEKAQLDEGIKKILRLLVSDSLKELSYRGELLLFQQEELMHRLSSVLGERIDLFQKQSEHECCGKCQSQ